MSNVNVNLSFTADTSKAKAALADLQSSLQKLISGSNASGSKDFGISKQISEATAAAAELKAHLQAATNIKTGNLDFTKLNDSLKASGTNLSEYGAKLQALGPAGQQAFAKLTQSVAMAEIPIKNANTLLSQFATTLKNTAKWQISSSILHGFMGAVQSAYGYAQDLNESLNNIRIVTGYSADKMADFAKTANEAARSLSTTTTAYTDASLIYYQQGLNDAQVKERTDVTIKMANVARESATVVSDQMTAIWNNFDNGSHSLEYYADVMTKLGAATAASTSEIATGLEKFAAISETVGLSYEYATAALTTVVDRTRQSADVVGTAFKTMFARIQGLKLGETLEDGTDLNQYSSALMAVGINIKNANGELKDMNVILDEMGSKWVTLNRDEQVALAQKVAGVRQYQQLIALMENYDFFKENVNLAKNSSGTLQEQADIYAESWEAAQKRVKAAAQKIYQDLLNDEVFIDMLNNVEKLLVGIDKFIQSVGGLKGVLTTLGAVVSQVFQKQMVQGLENAAHSLFMMTNAGKKAAQQQQQNMVNEMMGQLYGGQEGLKTGAQKAEEAGLRQQLELRQQLIDKSNQMSDAQRLAAQMMIDAHREATQTLVEEKNKYDEISSNAENLKSEFAEMAAELASFIGEGAEMSEIVGYFGELKDDINDFTRQQNRLNEGLMAYDQLQSKVRQMGEEFDQSKLSLEDLKNSIKQLGTNSGNLESLVFNLEKPNITAEEFESTLQLIEAEFIKLSKESSDAFKGSDIMIEQDTEKVDQYINSLRQLREQKKQVLEAEAGQANAFNATKTAMDAQALSARGLSQVLVSIFQSLNSVIAGVQMLKGAWDTLKDPNISGFEKFLRIMTSLTMAIPMFITGIHNVRVAWKALTSEKTISTIATGIETTAEWLNTVATKKNADVKREGAVAGHANADGARDSAISMGGEAVVALIDAKALTLRNKALMQSSNILPQLTSGYTDVSGAVEKTVGKFSKLGPAISKLGSALKGVVAKFGLAAVGIAVAAAAATAGSMIWNESTRKVEKATKELERTQKTLNSVMEDNSALNSKVDAYNAAQESLKGLVAGTTEYTNKLLENNQAAMNLIQTYSELNDKYTIGENGLIIIDPEALESVQKKTAEIVRLQQMSVLEKQNEIKELEIQAKLTELNRKEIKGNAEEEFWKTGSKDEFISSATGAGVGGGIGAAIGSLILPGIGTLMGAGIGMIAGAFGGQLYGNYNQETDDEKKAFSALAEAYKLQSNSIFKDEASIRSILENANINDDELVNSLFENRNSIESLIQQEISLESAQQALTEATWANIKSNNPEYNKTPWDWRTLGLQQSNELAGKNITENVLKTTYKTYQTEGESGAEPGFWEKVWKVASGFIIGLGGADAAAAAVSTNADEERSSRAARSRVIDWGKSKYGTSFTDEGNDTFTYSTTENGEVQKHTLNYNDLVDQYAQALSETDIDTLMKTTQPIRDLFYSDFSEKFLQAWENSPLAETHSLTDTQGMLNNAISLFSKSNVDENGQFTLALGDYKYNDVEELKAQINPILQELVEDDVAIAYGFNSSDELLETVNKNWDAYQQQWNTISKSNRDQLQEQNYSLNEALKLNNLATQNNSDADVKEVVKLYEKVLGREIDEKGNDFGYTKLKDDKEKKLFFEIDFDQNATEEQIERAFDYLQQEAEQKEVKIKLSATLDAEEALENLDYESLTKPIEHKNDDGEVIGTTQMHWGQDGLIEFQEFLAKSYGEQKAYLQQVEMDQRAAIANHATMMQETLGEQLNSYQSEMSILQDSLAKMYQMRDQIQSGTATGNLDKLNSDIQLTVDRINTLNGALGDTQTKMASAEADIQNYISALASTNDIDQSTLEAVTKVFQETYSGMKDNEKAAAELAARFIKMENAVDYAKEHMEEFSAAVKKAKNAHTTEQKALLQMDTNYRKLKTTMADILGVSEDLFTDDFIKNNFEDFQKGVNGSTEAMNKFKASFIKLNTGTDLPTEQIEAFLNELDKVETGREINIDAGSALDEFLKVQVAAAKTEEDLKNRLSGIPIEMDLVGYYDTMEAAEAAAAECGGYVAADMSMDAEVTPVQGVEKDNIQNVSFTESYSSAGLVPFTSTVTEMSPDGLTTTTTPVTSYYNRVKKEVDFDKQEETGEKENSAASVHMSPGGNAQQNNVGKIPVYKPKKIAIPSGCFVAGTLITTINGFKNIEDIQIGDIVLSYNEELQKNEYSEVLQTMIHTIYQNIYKLYIEDEIIEVTGNHKILINRNIMLQWLRVDQIQIGDKVLFANGTLHEIKNIEIDIRLETVYNFEVSDNHNYYVGKNQMLAHNKGNTNTGCFEARTLVSTILGFKNIEDIQVGDIVLSYNEITKQNEYSQVLQTMIHDVKENIYRLYIEDEILTVTGIHRFLILRDSLQSWIHAEDLIVGDKVLFADGTLHKIHSITIKEEIMRVYNFEVSKNHNYYVGKNQILAHNKGCFEAGTLITKDNGFAPIENIKIGDIVLSYNEETKKNEYSEVVDTMIHIIKDKIYHLYIEEDVLNVTDIHKFLIIDNKLSRWVEAQYLQVGDSVLLADGTIHQIQKIEIEEKFVTVYNFEVADNHNYYVGQNQVLAHNKGGGGGGGKKSTPAEKVKPTRKSDVVSRYVKTKRELEKINQQLDKYNKLNDMAYGPKKIKNMQNVINLLDLEIQKEKELIKEIEKNTKVDKDTLLSDAKVLGLTVEFDADGFVSNQQKMEESIYNKKHEMELKKGSLKTKEEQDEYDKEVLNPYEEQVEDFKKSLDLYNSTRQEFFDATSKILDISIEKASKKLEIVNEKLRQVIEARDLEIELFTNELEKLEDRAFSTTKQLKILGDEFKAIQSESQAVEKSLPNILKTGITRTVKNGKVEKQETLSEYLKKNNMNLHSFFKENGIISQEATSIDSNTLNYEALLKWLNDSEWSLSEEGENSLQSALDQLKTLYSSLIEIQNAIDAMPNNIFEKYLDSIDKNTRKMDRLINRYETWMSIVDELGAKRLFGDNFAEMSLALYQGQIDANIEQMKQLQDIIETEKEMEKDAKRVADIKTKRLRKEINATDIEKENQQYMKDMEASQERYNELLAKREKHLENIKNAWTDAEENEFRFYEARISGATTYTPRYNNGTDAAKPSEYLVNPDYYKGESESQYLLNEDLSKQAVHLKNGVEVRVDAIKELQKQETVLRKEIKATSDKAKKEDLRGQLQTNQDNQTALKNEIEEYYNALDEINDAQSDYEKILEDREEREQQQLELLVANLQLIKAQALKEIEFAYDKLEQDIAGIYSNLDQLRESFEMGTKISDEYLGDYEKIYQLNKLNRDLEKRMDESSNLKVKEKLAKFQEKILAAAKENVKMSQYDLEYMQKQYDLEVARIALEEAQNAKTQVRLSRDAEGNFSYVYTADEDKTAEAQQKYEDQLNDLIKLSNDYQKEMLNNTLSLQNEELDKLKDLSTMLAEGTIDTEEFERRKDLIQAEYAGLRAFYANEQEKAAANNAATLTAYNDYYGKLNNLITESANIHSNATEQELREQEAAIEMAQEAARQRSEAIYNTTLAYHDGSLEAQDYITQLNKALEEHGETIEGVFETTNGQMNGVILNATEHFLPFYTDTWTSAIKINSEFDKSISATAENTKNTLLGMEGNIRESLAAMNIEIGENETVWGALGRAIVTNTLGEKGDGSGGAAKAIKDLTKTFKDENFKFKTEYDIASANVASWYTSMSDTIDALGEKIEELIKEFTNLIVVANGQTPIEPKPQQEPSQEPSGSPSDASGWTETFAIPIRGFLGTVDKITPYLQQPQEGAGSQRDGKLQVGDKVTFKEGYYYEDSWGGGKKGNKYLGKTVVINSYSNGTEVKNGTGKKTGDYSISISSPSGEELGWIKKSQISVYDTGGYTGAWGADGRWALLHQKELVLNAQDTENMLAAVKTVRQIAEMVDLKAQQASLAGQYALALGQFADMRQPQQIDQNVHITAEFPNVQDHNEIEMALSSLVNRASQFAWRN